MAQKAVAAAMAQRRGSFEHSTKTCLSDGVADPESNVQLDVRKGTFSHSPPRHRNGTKVLAVPLHLQRVQRALNLAPVMEYVEGLFSRPVKRSCGRSNGLTNVGLAAVEKELIDQEKRVINGRPYQFSQAEQNGQQWLKELLMSDSSDEETLNNDGMHLLLAVHSRLKDPVDTNQLKEYHHYSARLLSSVSNWPVEGNTVDSDFVDEHPQMTMPVVNPPIIQIKPSIQKKLKVMRKKKRKPSISSSEDEFVDDDYLPDFQAFLGGATGALPRGSIEPDMQRKKLWAFIVKKEIPKVQRQKSTNRNNLLSHAKKVASLCQKEVRKKALKSQKCSKDTISRARRLTREMLAYWKKYEKVERENRKRAEKEALEQRKLEDEMREARRQQRKLNFLITQTELYAHFMAKKLIGDKESATDRILKKLDEAPMQRQGPGGRVVILEGDDYDVSAVKSQVIANVQEAVHSHETKTQAYDAAVAGNRTGKTNMQMKFDESYSLANPMMDVGNAPQPSFFDGQLKSYQLKGMNWLASLYHQGINGILADEMGLGKTVQSIALLAHLAETQNIWGPFLVVAPASTLHNWQQEVSRFVPMFRVLPYWGTLNERKILRKYVNQDRLTAYTKDAPCHIVVTSYQIVISDVKFFQRLQWQYLILDEAQAIKSSSSIRWKILLGFKCRNRLLLTGTPIQNTMAELWSLLHFIMPTLFDSHAEFNEWFSKDIESHAEKKSGLDENQLSRLHLILKPFMLRRVKKDVENEMADKIEIQLTCQLTQQQRRLYQGVRNKISIEELLRSTTTSSAAQASSNTLMNLVMQLRKVCNHPDLFERRDVRSPFVSLLPEYELPYLLFREELLGEVPREMKRLFFSLFSIWSTEYIHHSLFPANEEDKNSCFSFLRFMDVSPNEAFLALLGSFYLRLLDVLVENVLAHQLYHQRTWVEADNVDSISSFGKRDLLLRLTSPLSAAAVSASAVLQDLVFTSHTSTVTSRQTHTIYRSHYNATMPHSMDGLQKVHTLKSPILQSPVRGVAFNFCPRSPQKLSSPTKTVAPQLPTAATESLQDLLCDPMLPVEMTTPLAIRQLQATSLPSFLLCCVPKAAAAMRYPYIVDRNAEHVRQKLLRGGRQNEQTLIVTGLSSESRKSVTDRAPTTKMPLYPSPARGLEACRPEMGWSHIQIPDKELLVIDSTKLNVLDRLLCKLKRERHRVLIYCQMTRMIDLLEEYMGYRKHKYIRLDGSSKIADRRDMVADFQSRSDIFVFLLSTRAGGLGINLTAADTVIFYDSDWNPTVDQQAMDRAHRLGQTKQVTVYRLVTKGTVEERILQRAKEKSEIQKMVISGGQFRPDALKPKEVVSLLLDDAEMESKFLQRQAEQEQMRKKRRKKPVGNQQGTPDTSASKKPKSRTATLKVESGIDSQQASPAVQSYPPSVMSSIASNDIDDDELEIDLSMTGEALDDFPVAGDLPVDAEDSLGEPPPLSPSALFIGPTVGKGRGTAGRGKGRGGRKNRKAPGSDSGTPPKKAKLSKPRAGLSAQSRSAAGAATAQFAYGVGGRVSSGGVVIQPGQNPMFTGGPHAGVMSSHQRADQGTVFHSQGRMPSQQQPPAYVPAVQPNQTNYQPHAYQNRVPHRTGHFPSLYSRPENQWDFS